MADEAAEHRIPLALVTVPVNLRDWRPNVSVHGLSGAALERWSIRFEGARGALLRGDAERALALVDEAVALAPEHAETRFVRGRVLEALDRPEAALASYQRAVDLDRNPFRALSEFNTVLRSLARARRGGARRCRGGVPRGERAARARLRPVPRLRAPDRARQRGARAHGVRGAGAAGPGASRGPARFRYPQSAAERGYHAGSDTRMQLALLALYSTMHQYEPMVETARRLAGAGQAANPLVGAVLQVFPRHLALEERRLRGLPVSEAQWRRSEAAVKRFYAEQVEALAPAT